MAAHDASEPEVCRPFGLDRSTGFDPFSPFGTSLTIPECCPLIERIASAAVLLSLRAPIEEHSVCMQSKPPS
jgi:hypothetical protein